MNNMPKIAAAVLSVVSGTAALTACSSTTVTPAGQQSPRPSVTQSAAPGSVTPGYDLKGFERAVTGPEMLALKHSMDALGSEPTAGKARSAVKAADDWLAVLRPTSPPPQWQAAKQRLVTGVGLIRKGFQEMADGITNGDQPTLDQAGQDEQQGTQLMGQVVEQVLNQSPPA